MWRWCGENANCANFPNSGFVFGLLTSIFIWPFVFDISGELCKYVVPRCVGFPILWCKFGIPKKHEHGVSEDVPRLVLFSFLRVWGILWWNQHLLQVLLYFVDVSENLPLEGEEGRVCTRGQVVKVSRFPKWSRIILQPLLLNCDEMPLCFFMLILVNKQCSFVCLLLLLVPTTLGPHFHSIYCFVHYPHVLLKGALRAS